jgi:hypothetical protein
MQTVAKFVLGVAGVAVACVVAWALHPPASPLGQVGLGEAGSSARMQGRGVAAETPHAARAAEEGGVAPVELPPIVIFARPPPGGGGAATVTAGPPDPWSNRRCSPWRPLVMGSGEVRVCDGVRPSE